MTGFVKITTVIGGVGGGGVSDYGRFGILQKLAFKKQKSDLRHCSKREERGRRGA